MKAISMALMQMGMNAYAIGEVSTPGVSKGDVVIAATNKGKTASTCLFMEQAKKQGAYVVLITSMLTEKASTFADLIIELTVSDLDNENLLTDSYFEYSLMPLGDCLVEALAEKKGFNREQILHRHANLE